MGTTRPGQIRPYLRAVEGLVPQGVLGPSRRARPGLAAGPGRCGGGGQLRTVNGMTSRPRLTDPTGAFASAIRTNLWFPFRRRVVSILIVPLYGPAPDRMLEPGFPAWKSASSSARCAVTRIPPDPGPILTTGDQMPLIEVIGTAPMLAFA